MVAGTHASIVATWCGDVDAAAAPRLIVSMGVSVLLLEPSGTEVDNRLR